MERIISSATARELIRELKRRHGPLMFHISGGCCDGSQPMCLLEGEFRLGSRDLLLGEVEGCSVYMSADQYEYCKYTQLLMNVTPGRGSSFSLEIPMGLRFITESRMFTEEELALLPPLEAAIPVY